MKYKEQGQKIFNAGELTAIISYTDIFDRLIDRITIVFITNAVKTFCAVFIIFFIFQFVITRHLKEMAMWARNLNFDKLDSRFSLDRQKPNVPDELEEVVIALNDMRKRILLELAANKKAEMALKESEEKFRSIFENSPIATVHLNNLGITTACNDNFCDIMGGPKEKIIGLDTIQFVKDERMLASILKALSGRKSQYEGKYLSVTGGILTPVNAKFAPVLSVKDQVIGVIGILEDISERLAAEQNNIKLEDQLRQTQKMEAVSMLAGGIAHDFNNMLGVITGNVSYSLSIIDKDNEVYEVLTDILEGAAQAQKLTQQLLTFSTGGGSG
ncbi:MAG: PAS domain S-box protein [Desulfobacteraceae bacterium]|nr:PAS domain S-box protein [Desulfobacteraceae bacterium]